MSLNIKTMPLSFVKNLGKWIGKGIIVGKILLGGDVTAQVGPNTPKVGFEINNTTSQLVMTLEARPGYLFNTLPTANSTSTGISRYNPATGEFEQIAAVSRDIPNGIVTDVEFIGGSSLNTPGVRYVMSLSSLTDGIYGISQTGRSGPQGSQTVCEAVVLIEVVGGEINIRGAAGAQEGVGAAWNNLYTAANTEFVIANNIDINSFSITPNNDGFTLTGEIEKMEIAGETPGTIPIDLDRELTIVFDDGTTLDIIPTYTRDATLNKYIVSADLPADCGDKITAVKIKDHSDFTNPITGPNGDPLFLPTDGLGNVADGQSESIAETPSFVVTEYTATPNGNGTYEIIYTVGNIPPNRTPVATLGSLPGVFSNNNTIVTFSNVNPTDCVNCNVTITNGSCENVQLLDLSTLSINEVGVDIVNNLSIVNPVQNGMLEIKYPKSVSHLDITVMNIQGQVIHRYENIAQDTAIPFSPASGMYLMSFVDSHTGLGVVKKVIVQ